MGRKSIGKAAGGKDPFEDLDEEFKSLIEGSDEGQIRAKISEVAIQQVQLKEAEDQDLDLAEKKALAKDAGLMYTEGTKMNKLKIMYAKQMLDSRGKLQ